MRHPSASHAPSKVYAPCTDRSSPRFCESWRRDSDSLATANWGTRRIWKATQAGWSNAEAIETGARKGVYPKLAGVVICDGQMMARGVYATAEGCHDALPSPCQHGGVGAQFAPWAASFSFFVGGAVTTVSPVRALAQEVAFGQSRLGLCSCSQLGPPMSIFACTNEARLSAPRRIGRCGATSSVGE